MDTRLSETAIGKLNDSSLRRMTSSEGSVPDMNWSCGGNAVATRHSGSNDDFQKDVCDIDACQGDTPSSQREEHFTRQIQMDNSVYC